MKLTWQRRRVHLQHPFNIARAMSDAKVERDALLVRIDHGGKTGWGESAPSTYYKQSHDSGIRVFEAAEELLGDDPFRLEDILDRLWAKFPGESAAIAAIDGALYDLVGKLLDVPVWKMLGLNPTKAPLTSFTIGIDKLDVIAAKVREAAEYPILKIKVGTPDDIAILETVRREAPDKVLRVDANCGWTSANALQRSREIAKYRLELIEQPTPAGDNDALPALREQEEAPIIADESCVGYKDVLRCVGPFDGVNIKLSKCGGIRRGLQMIHTARSAGLKLMIGCMVETSVGIAAAAQLTPLLDYVDLDGHLLLADDPFEGIGGARGKLTLSERPGLGVRERA